MSDRTRFGLLLCAAAAGVGILGDLLLRATPWGINVLLWVAALIAVLAFLGRRPEAARGSTGWLALPILLFAAGFAWRDSPVLKALDGAAILACLCLAAMRWRSARVPDSGAVQYALSAVWTAINTAAGWIPLVGQEIRWSEIPRGG